MALDATADAAHPSEEGEGMHMGEHDRDFIVKTWTLFASLQRIALEEQKHNGLGGGGYEPNAISGDALNLTPATMQYFNRISKLYREAVIEQIQKLSSNLPPVASTSTSTTTIASQIQHLAILHSTLSLTEILYLPSSSSNDLNAGEGLVGEELLDWLNKIDPSPTKQEGEALIGSSTPWTDQGFWNYVYKCILRGHLVSATTLLSFISNHHPSPWLQRTSEMAIQLITTFPRSTAFETDHQYLTSFRSWRQKASKTLLKHQQNFDSPLAQDDPSFTEGTEEEIEEEKDDWFAAFNVLFSLLNGRETTLLESCSDWKEVLICWGIWIQPSLRRNQLPDLFESITTQKGETFIVEAESIEEHLQAGLFQGDPVKVLNKANLLPSPWLAAHLADLLDKLGVVDQPVDRDTFPTKLRDFFVVRYAEALLKNDKNLWRIVVEYLASDCGEQGLQKMKQVLKGVDLIERDDQGMEQDGKEGEGEKQRPIIEDVLTICAQHGLEDEIIEICQTYSEHLMSQQRYGEALSFCIRSGDLKRISRIADRILDEYLLNGQEAFVRHVDSIPTSLLKPPRASSKLTLPDELFGRARQPPRRGIDSDDEEMIEDESDKENDDVGREGAHLLDGPLAPYSTRLSFLARYRDFFALYARGERKQAAALLILLLTSNVAPKHFYAVLLLDAVPLLAPPSTFDADEILLVSIEETYELLRCLEEVTGPIEASDGQDVYGHLTSLSTLISGQAKGEDGDTKERTRKGMKQLDVVREALG